MNTTLSSCHRPVCTTLSMLLIGCLAATSVLAETRYVKPSLEVTIRQGQNNTSKTVANVPIGTPVELVKGEKEWSLVRLPNAGEGWVRSRFLSSTPILPVSNLKGGGEGAPVDISIRFKELHDENGRLRKEFAACTTDRSTLADKYQTLVGDPNSVLHTKTSLGEAQQQIEELQAKLATAQIENTVLRKNESIKWFFVGSSVLLLGWLLGRLTSSSRKKKPSLI
jgi:SH3 domain protein